MRQADSRPGAASTSSFGRLRFVANIIASLTKCLLGCPHAVHCELFAFVLDISRSC